MDHEPDYSNYTRDELIDAATHINREKYRERTQRIDEEIARRRKEKNGIVLETLSVDKQIAWRIKAIQSVYACLAWLGGMAAFFVLLGMSKKHTFIEALEVAITVCACFFACYGLKRRRSW